MTTKKMLTLNGPMGAVFDVSDVDGVATVTVDGVEVSVSYLGVYTWALRPSAASNAGKEFDCSSLGAYRTRFYSDGTYWRPVNGECALFIQGGASIALATGTTEVVNAGLQVPIPAGLLFPGCTIEVSFSPTKSSTSETATMRHRLGAPGTITDTQICDNTTTMATTVRQAQFGARYKVVSATSTLKSFVQTLNLSGTSTAAPPAAVTVSNVLSTDLILSLGVSMSSTVEVVTISDYTVKLIG